MHRWSPVILAQETTAYMLLLHTVAVLLYLSLGITLLRALITLRRTGERPAGFLAIAILILSASAGRAVWLAMVWLNVPPPPWLDLALLYVVYICIVSVPITLSAFHVPTHAKERERPRFRGWLHWAMLANAFAGALILTLGFVSSRRSFLLLGPPAVYTLAAVLLCFRISSLRNLQMRRRGLLLFAVFTSAGLLTLSAVFVYGFVSGVPVRRSVGTVTILEFSSLLMVVGMLFVFANLRLADVIVKRVLRLAMWACTSFLVWLVLNLLARSLLARTGVRPEAALNLVCILLIGSFSAASPPVVRLLDHWVDRWLFEQPDFEAAIKTLWDRLLHQESPAEVFRETEDLLRQTLSLSRAQITSFDRSEAGAPAPAGPGWFFRQTVSVPGRTGSIPDIRVPLFVEGAAANCILLSRGPMRPPLTAMEIGFIERAATQVQIRLENMLSEERRIEGIRRETAFRAEISDAELRALRAQINPHFLFNSLNTIADLTVTAPARAEQMTLRLSSVFRYVLVNSDKQFASVKEEINFVRSYLDIEEFRFGDRLRTSFQIDPAVLEERIPTLLLQPLIENALKHGIAPKRSGGTITIRAKAAEAGLVLVVADDGVGLDRRSEPSPKSTYVGLSNIRRRLATAYQGFASFTLRPREGGGTEAIVTIGKGWQQA